jgi:hypothetical protein
MTSGFETEILDLAQQIWGRTVELALAPFYNQDMLWIAIPLLIATLFMTLYFGRYEEEELGWNTAFGNTMVFVFVAINLIKEMYKQGGSFEALFETRLYFLMTVGLTAAGIFLMFVTYFHLIPKRLAFFLFSAPPINVSIYVAMAIVYANVPTDRLTAFAGLAFLILILLIGKALQFLLSLVGFVEHGVKVIRAEQPEEGSGEVKKIGKNFKKQNKKE